MMSRIFRGSGACNELGTNAWDAGEAASQLVDEHILPDRDEDGAEQRLPKIKRVKESANDDILDEWQLPQT